jgi:hypothetical protein
MSAMADPRTTVRIIKVMVLIFAESTPVISVCR